MENTCEIEKTVTESKRKQSFFSSVKSILSSTDPVSEAEKNALLQDVIIFTVGFLLSRCHLMFGAHPVGLAFVAALPFGVWSALVGAVIGALSMGIHGVIFDAVSAITVFLRAAVSVGDKVGGLFRESLMLRMSISILGGFISSVYEVLLYGLDEASMLFGICMVIFPPLLTFAFSGLFSTEIKLTELIGGERNILSTNEKSEKERYNIIFFQISSLLLIFFIGLSFKGVSILGISLSYLFSAVTTLAVAKRFGGVRGMAAGFASSLGASGVLSVAFALMGLSSGALFRLGTGYAVIMGGIGLSAFSAYSSGLSGLLATLPEYLIGTVVSLPLLKRIGVTRVDETEEKTEESSEDMVGIMALAFQKDYSGSVDALCGALSLISSVMKSYAKAPGILTVSEYREIVIGIAERYCIGCDGITLCNKEGIRPCIKGADKLAKLLCEGKRITAEEVNTNTEFCQMAEAIANEINHEAAKAERESYLTAGRCLGAEEYGLMCTLLKEAQAKDEEEKVVDNSMTASLTNAIEKCGIENGTIRVFGKRRRHFILAGDDSGGGRITSFELRKSIEEAAGVKLASPEYFRRGKIILMECGIRRKLSVKVAVATISGSESEVSGDSISYFETGDDYFYSLISDGMGSGEVARETSLFASEFIKEAMEIGTGKETVMHMLNRAIKSRGEECSATVDLFELDLLNGSGVFIKSGAAPSFIKRDSSIFRIRSHTAPIGLMSSIDTEKIKAEIKPGDHIIMMSDGIADESEDAPWLLLLLGDPPKKDLKEYAEAIISEAKKNRKTKDDMTVAIIRVEAV